MTSSLTIASYSHPHQTHFKILCMCCIGCTPGPTPPCAAPASSARSPYERRKWEAEHKYWRNDSYGDPNQSARTAPRPPPPACPRAHSSAPQSGRARGCRI